MRPSRTRLRHGKANGLKPDFFAESVASIDFAAVSELGANCLVLDVDHTLSVRDASDLPSELGKLLHEKLTTGYVEAIFIASNSRRDLSGVAERIGAKVIRPRRLLRKPSRTYLRRILRKTGYRPEQTVMVGDKLVNDVWGGNRVGMYTILVRPIGRDRWFDRLIGRRFWGRWLLRHQR